MLNISFDILRRKKWQVTIEEARPNPKEALLAEILAPEEAAMLAPEVLAYLQLEQQLTATSRETHKNIQDQA